MISGGPANAQTLSARELEASYTAFSPIVTAIAGGAPIKVVAGFGRGFVHQLFTKTGTGVMSARTCAASARACRASAPNRTPSSSCGRARPACATTILPT